MKSLLAGLIFSILALTSASSAFAQMPPQAPMCGQNRPRVTPTQQKIYDRMMRRFGALGLSPQQQGQMQSLIGQFSQTHPAGSPLDTEAMHQLHRSILQVLTPQQFDTLRQENEQRRGQMGGGGGGHHCGQ